MPIKVRFVARKKRIKFVDATSICYRNMYFRSRSSLNLSKNLTGRAVGIFFLAVLYYMIVILNIDVKKKTLICCKVQFPRVTK